MVIDAEDSLLSNSIRSVSYASVMLKRPA